MGGTLARRGGHSILEPAYFAKPVIVGPHMENFAEIAEEFSTRGALHRISEPGALGSAVGALLDDARRSERARRASTRTGIKRGVVDRNAGRSQMPRRRRSATAARLTARMLLTPLSWFWRMGNRINLARRLRKREDGIVGSGD